MTFRPLRLTTEYTPPALPSHLFANLSVQFPMSRDSRTHRGRLSRRSNAAAGPHYETDPTYRARLRELESAGDPLSLAECIANDPPPEHPSSTSGEPAPHASVEAPASDDLLELQALPHAELVTQAISEGIANADEYSRQDLFVEIIKGRVKSRGMMYGEGTLEILPDGFGFLRSPKFHYLSCPDDIYVSPSQIRKFKLKTGAVVGGQIRPPKEKERYFALLRVEKINGNSTEANAQLASFDELTPLHPNERICMEHDPNDLSTRVVDMFAPIGFGQRGLIVSPPRAGKTMLMQSMARSVLENYPDAYVFMLLVDERPEEVTDMEREVRGDQCEVISSTFDESPARHIQVSEMVLEKAKRMVENGVDVVIFLDSITRLSRAWNQECTPSGKTLSGGLDANAMQKPKAFFGSARKVEEGGSLTLIATALVDTGSKMDDVIFEEFKGTGNLEIVLDRVLVERRIWPAIDLNATGTRREEKLIDANEYTRICQIRRELSQLNAPDAMRKLTDEMRKFKTNAEFLMSVKPEGQW